MKKLLFWIISVVFAFGAFGLVLLIGFYPFVFVILIAIPAFLFIGYSLAGMFFEFLQNRKKS